MIGDVFGILGVAIPYIIKAESGGAKGSDKKAEVIAAIEAEIAKPGGLEYPAWLPSAVRPTVISATVELGVFLFNRFGGPEFLKKFTA